MARPLLLFGVRCIRSSLSSNVETESRDLIARESVNHYSTTVSKPSDLGGPNEDILSPGNRCAAESASPNVEENIRLSIQAVDSAFC